MSNSSIDPALGIELVPERTLNSEDKTVCVLIPAHNEEQTVAHVVKESLRGLELLGAQGEVVVCASGCTDNTAPVAVDAGARVVVAPIGKGAAISAGISETSEDVVCLVDGDMQYFGKSPLVTELAGPIVDGIADACVTDLYWRPLYPQLWLQGFFAPLAGTLFPELLTKVGSTPWSGQRAAVRSLWPEKLPTDFTVDLALLFHWNRYAVRLRPVLADDWVNPQRPKPDLMKQEFEYILKQAMLDDRVSPDLFPTLRSWFNSAHEKMASYRPGVDDPSQFERELLRFSLSELHSQLSTSLP